MGRAVAKAELATSPGAERGTAADGSLLRRYLREVRAIQPLSGEEEKALGLELVARRREVGELLTRIPELAGEVRELESTDYPGSALGELYVRLSRTPGSRRGPGARRAREAKRAIAALLALRDRFVKANLRLVIYLSRPYREGRSMAWLDLIQEGNLGLVRAVEKFDARRGFKFSSYAVWWIEQAFVRGRQRQDRAIRLPTQVHGELAARRRAETRLTGLLGREPGAEELASELGYERERVDGLLALDQELLSLQAPLREGTQQLADVLAAPPRDLVGDLDTRRGCARLGTLLEGLEPRERSILVRRFGLAGDSESLAQVGDRLGLSRERVRQIEQTALRKLREGFAAAS